MVCNFCNGDHKAGGIFPPCILVDDDKGGDFKCPRCDKRYAAEQVNELLLEHIRTH